MQAGQILRLISTKGKQHTSGVSDYTITKYELSDDKNVLTTTYSKDGASDVVISVDKKNATATVGTEVYDLADCIEGGLTE